MSKLIYLTLPALLTMSGCMHTEEPNNDINAVLDAPSSEAIAQVKSAVAELLGRPEITMSKSAFVKKSSIAIEKAIKLSNDPNISGVIKLQLVKRGENCLIKHVSTGQTIGLPGVSCKPE